ncbi:MAG: YdcF family protein [Bacteroidales bacterium]|nr:YdcF family protein [Bacteroidales bacterium]
MFQNFVLFRKRKCWRPTFWGWILLLLVLGILFRLWMVTVSVYLSEDHPVPAKILVVEGWVEDEALTHAVALYHKDHYRHLVVTGLPITFRKDYLHFKNTAQAAVAQIKKDGFKDTIYEAVIPSTVYIDRTYNTAIATRKILEQHPEWGKSFNLYSVGVHARRSHLMFERAFGDGYQIGIISEKDPTFDPAHWWRTSKGFRNVSNEFMAYVYVWAFFHPDYAVFEKKLEEGYQHDRRLLHTSDSIPVDLPGN